MMGLENVNLFLPSDQEPSQPETDPGRQEIPPLGALYVAAALEESGHMVRIIRITAQTKPLDIPSGSGAIAALALPSSMTMASMLELKDTINTQHELTVAGGTHARIYPRDTLTRLDATAVFVGEAEETLPKFLAQLSDADTVEEAAGTLPGIHYLDHNGEPGTTGGHGFVRDLSFGSQTPTPARHLLDDEEILLRDRIADHPDAVATTLITSRGCPYSCRFCANPKLGSVRYRSGVDVAMEVEQLLSQYPSLDALILMDETMTLNRNHVRDITTHLQPFADKGLRYVVSSRADRMDEEVVSWLQQSGCEEVKFGFESGSQSLLDRMDKRINLEESIEGVLTTARGGLGTKLFLVHGTPGENAQTTTDTITAIQRLWQEIGNINRSHRANQRRPVTMGVNIFRFTPLPGSEYWDKAAEYGIHTENAGANWEHLSFSGDTYPHWWGTAEDHAIVNEQYQRLSESIASLFGNVNARVSPFPNP